MNEVELSERIHAAVLDLYATQPPHDVPSPSGVRNCTRQQWSRGTRQPITNYPPTSTIVKMEAGKGIEPFWRDVYRAAGYNVTEREGERFSIADVMTGEFDLLITDPETEQTIVVDLKNLGWYGYIKLHQLGVQAGAPDYYTQLQCYMLGQPKCSGAILHVGVQDWNAANILWKRGMHQFGRQETDLPDFLVFYIAPDEAEQYSAVRRAQEIKYLIENETEMARVPREYNPNDPKDAKFPCGYCAVFDACRKAG